MSDLQVDFGVVSPVNVTADLESQIPVASVDRVVPTSLLSYTTNAFQSRWADFIAGKYLPSRGCSSSTCTCHGGVSKYDTVLAISNTSEFYMLTKLFTSGFDSARVLEDVRYINNKFHTNPISNEPWEVASEYPFLHPEFLGVILLYSCETPPASSTSDANALYASVIANSVRVRELFTAYISGSSITLDATLRTELFDLLYKLIPNL